LIAEQIWDTLVPNRGLHGISDADRPWFMFGALGPAIGDFIPSGAPPAGAPAGATGPRSPYYSVWQNAFELAVGNPAKKLPDLVSTITTLQQGIDQLATIVANHDFGAARAFQQSSLPGIQTASNDLNTIISNFAGGAQLSTIGGLVGAGSRPAIDNTLVVVSPDQWTGREWLHWKQPGNFTGGGTASAGFSNTTTFQGAEDMSLVRGAHHIGFGVNYIHTNANAATNLNTNATFAFTIQGTNLGLADFLTGNVATYIQGEAQTLKRQHYLGAYVQDSWRAGSHITINGGLRWEPMLPAVMPFGWLSHFDLSSFLAGVKSIRFVNAPAGVLFPGDAHGPS
jgi:hypothetical protein